MVAAMDAGGEQQMESGPPPPPISPAAQLAYRILGLAALAVGIAGAFLPLLPTTVFLIVAAWAFGKSSPALHAWLYRHPTFGPPLRDWDERGAIGPRAKAMAVAGMSFGLLAVWLASRSALPTAAAAAVLLGCAVFVLTRPSS